MKKFVPSLIVAAIIVAFALPAANAAPKEPKLSNPMVAAAKAKPAAKEVKKAKKAKATKAKKNKAELGATGKKKAT